MIYLLHDILFAVAVLNHCVGLLMLLQRRWHMLLLFLVRLQRLICFALIYVVVWRVGGRPAGVLKGLVN